jgi:hypothetical protein
LRLDRSKPQSGVGCGASKAGSGRHICASADAGRDPVSGSAEPGAQPETAIAHPSAQTVESLAASPGRRTGPLAPGRTRPEAGREDVLAQAAAAAKGAGIRCVLRRRVSPVLSRIMARSPRCPATRLDRRPNPVASFTFRPSPVQGSIATAMRRSGEWFASPASRTSHCKPRAAMAPGPPTKRRDREWKA